MRLAIALLLFATLVTGASSLSAATKDDAKDKTSLKSPLVTLPPQKVPFDPELLARIRASLEGAPKEDSKGQSETEADH